ncbi:hypothetical protein ACQY0O_001158 [Thecaphora frezii]
MSASPLARARCLLKLSSFTASVPLTSTTPFAPPRSSGASLSIHRRHRSATLFAVPSSRSSSPSSLPLRQTIQILSAVAAAPAMASVTTAATGGQPWGADLEAFTPSPSKFNVFRPYERDDAKDKAAQLLQDNHEKHHCFFNAMGFHNHAAHQILADYSIGATAEQLEARYKREVSHYLAGFKLADRSKYDPYSTPNTTVEKVDLTNWTDFFGRPSHYWSYLHFFDAELKSRGLAECLEWFVMSDEANRDGRHMLARFYGSVIHGLIHFGYGAEFDLLPVAAEGLAMTACTSVRHLHLFPNGWEKQEPHAAPAPKRLVPLMKEMLEDDRLSPEALGLTSKNGGLPDEPFEAGGKAAGLINEYADRWALTAKPTEDDVHLDAAIADLAWYSALVVGAVPRLEKYYRHDFFLMHANNAHLFTPALVPLLSKQNQRTYLRALLRTYLHLWVARGRPMFTAQHWKDEADPARAVSWDRMFEMAREDDDEHLPKAIRALHYFSKHIEGLMDDDDTQALVLSGLFDGEEALKKPHKEFDVFLLTARQMYHQQSGPEDVDWDFHGFYPDVPADARLGR